MSDLKCCVAHIFPNRCLVVSLYLLWVDTLMSTRGRLLESFISNHDLFILNTLLDDRTHSISSIDLSLCSSSISLDIALSVLDDPLYSNHFSIYLKQTSFSSPLSPRWYFQKADWPTFTPLTVSSLPPAAFSDIPPFFTFLQVTVLSAAFVAIPSSSHPFRSKSVSWWNPDCPRVLRIKCSLLIGKVIVINYTLLISKILIPSLNRLVLVLVKLLRMLIAIVVFKYFFHFLYYSH